MILSDADIEAIRKRCDAATPGPWTSGHGRKDSNFGEYTTMVHGADVARVAKVFPGNSGERAQTNANAEFIRNAKTDIPNLLADRSAFEAASKVALDTIGALTEKVKALEEDSDAARANTAAWRARLREVIAAK